MTEDNKYPMGPPVVGLILLGMAIYFMYHQQYLMTVYVLSMMVVLSLGTLYALK